MNRTDAISSSTANESPHLRLAAPQGKHLHSLFSGQAQQHATDAKNQTLKGVVGTTKLLDGQNKCVQHPRIGPAHAFGVVLQRRLKRKTARREHIGVAD